MTPQTQSVDLLIIRDRVLFMSPGGRINNYYCDDVRAKWPLALCAKETPTVRNYSSPVPNTFRLCLVQPIITIRL